MTDRSPPMKPEMIEAAAEAIYNLFTYDEPGEKPTWVERGNSFKQEDARRYAAAALSVPAAAVVGEPVCFPEAADVPVRERIERLVRDVKAGAIIGYDGPQEYWSTRMGAEASAEIARLLAIALSVETAIVGTSSLIKRASEMTDEEIAAERAIVEDRINGEFCEGGGSPGEWYYERHDELSAEQKRRADLGGNR